jgi:Adenine-specific methyltransferase EcoRI
MANSNLSKAKSAKNDEFYTQYQDIEKEIMAYLDFNPNTFTGKTILLPCDDPEWSNFTKFFAQNFERLGLKKMISTSYSCESKQNCKDYQPTLFETQDAQFDPLKTTKNGKIFTLIQDNNRDGKIDVNDLEWTYLEGGGDFKSEEIKKLRDEADIIITNPPFSLFRDFLAWIVEANKQFVIVGNMNAITYKEVFPLIKDNKMWLGKGFKGGAGHFINKYYEDYATATDRKEGMIRVSGVVWYTNLDHGRRHQPLPLMTIEDNIKFSKHKELRGKEYQKYDNYDAIEVPFTDAIPSNYDGAMGVPISFLDKYSPDQFIILGTSDNGLVENELKRTNGLTKEFVENYYKNGGTGAYKEGNPTAGVYQNNVAKMIYKRIFIKHKK